MSPTKKLTRACLTISLAVACGGDERPDEGSDGSQSGLGPGPTTLSASGSTGGDSDGGSGSGDTADTDGSSTDTGGSSGTSGWCVSDEECPEGQYCSLFTGACLDHGTCAVDEDCEGGFVCMDGACVIGGDCGASEFVLTQVPPNLMIVLDRSGSMDGDVDGTNKNRWEVAKDAIATVTTTFDAMIRFGLTPFSACKWGEECSAGEIEIPPGPMNAGAINGFLADKGFFYLCNSGAPETSTGNTLDALIGYPLLQDPTRTNAVMLITDGNENSECQTVTDAATAAAGLFAQQHPVRTYAVGFSNNIIGSLADVAAAGGTDQPYNASNPDELESALEAIASSVASCDFVLDAAPPDTDEVYVFFNDDPVPIPHDPDNGWWYDEATMTLHFSGAACELIQSGMVHDIDVVYGCPMPIPE